MPDFLFLPEQNYDCVRCGKSCTSFGVPVEPAAAERIKTAGPELRVLQEHQLPALCSSDGELRLNRIEGRCVLLDADNLCSLHGQFGFEAKPDACRLFPWVLIASRKGVRVSTSFFCTAVQKNQGRPLKEHLVDIEKLHQQRQTEHSQMKPVRLGRGTRLSWDAFELLHRRLEGELCQGLQPACRRAWKVLHKLRAGPPTATVEAVAAAFDQPEPLSQAASEQLDVKALCCLAALEGISKEHEASLIVDLCQGSNIELPRRDFSGSAAEVGALMQRLEPQLQEPLMRYVKAFLFRLGLGWTGSVQAGLMALSFLDTVFGFYVAISMLRAGRDNPETQDLAAGYDRLEGELGLHYRPPMAKFLNGWAEDFLDFLDQEQQVENS